MNQLFEECQGNPSAKLRVEHPDGSTTFLGLDRPFLTAGRSASCDLRLDHDEISPFQSLFLWIEGALFCCDAAPRTSFSPERFSSGNGQWVTHQPIDIGPYRVALEDNGDVVVPKQFPLNRSARLAADYPYIGLQFEGVKESENLWPVNRTLTLIGRSPLCKLRLNHKSVAAVQAGLMRTAEGCWLFDLAKDRKTGVNGYAIDLYPVDVGDVLQLGAFQIDVVTVGVQSTSTRDRAEDGEAAGRPSTPVARTSSRELQIPTEPSVPPAQEKLAFVNPDSVGLSSPVAESRIASARAESPPITENAHPDEANLAGSLESHHEHQEAVAPAILNSTEAIVLETIVVEPFRSAIVDFSVASAAIESSDVAGGAIAVAASESVTSSTLASLDQLEAACVALQSDEIVAIADTWPIAAGQIGVESEQVAQAVPADIATPVSDESVLDEVFAPTSSQELACPLDPVGEIQPADALPMAIVTDVPMLEPQADNETANESVISDLLVAANDSVANSSLQDSVAELEVVSAELVCDETLVAVDEVNPVVIDSPLSADDVRDEIETSIESWLSDVVAVPAVGSDSITTQKSSAEIEAIPDLMRLDESSTTGLPDLTSAGGNPPALSDNTVSDDAVSSIEPHSAPPAAVLQAVTATLLDQQPTLKNEPDQPRFVGKTFSQEFVSNPVTMSTGDRCPLPRRTPSGMLLPRKAQHKDFDPSKYVAEAAPNRIPVSFVEAPSPAVTAQTAMPLNLPVESNQVSTEHTNGFGTNGHRNGLGVNRARARKRNPTGQLRNTVDQSSKSAADVQVIAEFIQLQQAQLSQLKAQLAELENTYNSAAGSVISYRMRDSLAKPVSETLRCHDAMQESLEQLLKRIEH
ncbi:FHA domain-containing protein [Schlesneria paludicola]|uniref:FHA domain-containing protein n=1 Tax=Schlesneria paludicola TaxID=360056 RepID=UPI0012FCCD25|nr:FHA domain-containing protein [Schlesneria paludicola]